MSSGSMCRHCVGADPSRIKDGLIRCTKKHKFVEPNSTCPDYGFEYKPADIEEIRRSIIDYNMNLLENRSNSKVWKI